MDLCMSYLYEASKLVEEYTEIDLYRSVFEAGDVAVVEQKNEKIKSDSRNLLQKAVDVIKSIINKAKQLISNCLAWFTSSDEDKDKFKKFRDECAANPEFANMKISLTNWKEIEKAYAEAINSAEAEYKAIKDDEASAREGKLNDIMNKLKKTTTAATTSITVEAALRMAQDSQVNASRIKTALDLDLGLINKLESEIGEKETKKFKKKINSLNSRFRFRRWIAGARQSQGKKLQDCLSEIYNNVNGAYLKVDHRARGNDTYKTASNAIVGGALQGIAQNKAAAAQVAGNAASNTKVGGKLAGFKNKIFHGGEFNIGIDKYMNQFRDPRFQRGNLKKMNDKDLQTVLRQASNAQTELGNTIKTNQKAAKRFDKAGQLEWNKTLQYKSKLDSLVDNIQSMVDKRAKKSR